MGATRGSWLRWPSREKAARDGGGEDRWVVIDTETAGLDPERDALLAIGGVAVDGEGIRIDDSFEIVLQNLATSDRENILLHGIGREAQQQGESPAAALGAFARWLGDASYVGFHTDFDRAVLQRAAKEFGAPIPDRPWLDLAALAAALFPEMQRKGRGGLDDWLQKFAIDCSARHTAAGDALATAEILLQLRARAAAQGIAGHGALVRVARQQRWLGTHP